MSMKKLNKNIPYEDKGIKKITNNNEKKEEY